MSENNYKVIQTGGSKDLEKQLNEERSKGWQLHSFQASVADDNVNGQYLIVIAVLERPPHRSSNVFGD